MEALAGPWVPRRVVRAVLLAMERAGALDAAEERPPPHLRLTVFPAAAAAAALGINPTRRLQRRSGDAA